MSGIKIPVERFYEQVKDGVLYKGHIIINETTLEYGLEFLVTVPKLDDYEPVDGLQGIRKVFLLSLKKGEVEIDLTDEEYGFFFNLIVPAVVDFYHHPQTRGLNKGRIEKVIAPYGATVSYSMSSKGTITLAPELREMLNLPKFDCKIGSGTQSAQEAK